MNQATSSPPPASLQVPELEFIPIVIRKQQ